MSETSNDSLSIDELKRRLDEAEQTLEAICAGRVDAVIVDGPNGKQVYSLESPDQPFRTFVERMQEGALTLAENGTILYANSFFSRLVQTPLAEVIGAPLSRFVAAEYHYTAAHLLSESLENAVKGNCRLCVGADTIPVQLTLSPLVGGEARTSCAVVFDLRAREEMERAHAARIAAERDNAAKDQFLAMLSHELRSPLNTILGWSQILCDHPELSDYVRGAVQTIERNARAQAQLIADLLDISRIVAGKLHLQMEVVDFRALVEVSVAALRPTLEAQNLQLYCELPSEDAYVYGDATRLQQIVNNLLNNAAKFTDQGHIAVKLAVRSDALQLSVEDTGEGIPASLLDRIFDVFRQGDSPIERRKGGLGLGLAIAKELAEIHHGSIRVESPGPGSGATFVIELPRTRLPVEALHSPAMRRNELAGLHLLVIDDEPDNLDLTRHLFETCGARVKTADCASRALEMIDADQFDLVVSDIGLPHQDGLEMMREIRARGFDVDRLPAIALTGYAGEHDARLVAAAGFQMHLAKPVDSAELIRAASSLGRKRET